MKNDKSAHMQMLKRIQLYRAHDRQIPTSTDPQQREAYEFPEDKELADVLSPFWAWRADR